VLVARWIPAHVAVAPWRVSRRSKIHYEGDTGPEVVAGRLVSHPSFTGGMPGGVRAQTAVFAAPSASAVCRAWGLFHPSCPSGRGLLSSPWAARCGDQPSNMVPVGQASRRGLTTGRLKRHSLVLVGNRHADC